MRKIGVVLGVSMMLAATSVTVTATKLMGTTKQLHRVSSHTHSSSLLDLREFTNRGLKLMVRNPETGEVQYTTDGFFLKKGDYFYQNKMRLQGYPMTDVGLTTATCNLTDVKALDDVPAQATTAITYSQFNLDFGSAIIGSKSFDVNDVSTYNYQSDAKVYDRLGYKHDVTSYYVRVAVDTWDVHVLSEGVELTSNEVGQLIFQNNGALRLQKGLKQLTFKPKNGAGSQVLSFDYIDPTQFLANTMSTSSADGYEIGLAVAEEVDNDGFIYELYSNDLVQVFSRVALFK